MIIKAVPAGVLCGRSSSSAPPQPPEQRCEIDGEPPATRRQTTIGSSTASSLDKSQSRARAARLPGLSERHLSQRPCDRFAHVGLGHVRDEHTDRPQERVQGSWATGRRSPAHRPARSDSSTAGSREMINRLSKGSPIEESGFIIRDTA
jgi:hypothetical protein